jgi:hypothetical protein
MLEKRVSYDPENLPVEVGKDRYRGDRFRFVTEAVPFDLLPGADMLRRAPSDE